MRPRTTPDLDTIRERGWWRAGLSYGNAGIPCYWSPHLRRYVYINLPDDTEYVYDWHNGQYTQYTILWWNYNRLRGAWERVPVAGYYDPHFDPNR